MEFRNAIWQRIKRDAIDWADSGQPIPSPDQCRYHVRHIAATTMPPYSRISVEACGFYASELLNLIIARRSEKRQVPRAMLEAGRDANVETIGKPHRNASALVDVDAARLVRANAAKRPAVGRREAAAHGSYKAPRIETDDGSEGSLP